MRLRFTLFLLGILFQKLAFSQFTVDWGGMAEVNKSVKINDFNSLKNKVESRSFFEDRANNRSRIDFQSVFEHQLFLNKSLGAGAMYRFTDGGQVLRFIQQFALLNRSIKNLRVSHRFRSDQSLREESTEYRLRYRLAGQLPLSGLRLDANEHYIKAGVEALQKWRSSIPKQEVRFALSIGRSLTGKNKVELGLDLRYDGLFQDRQANSHWIRVGGYF